MRNSWDQWTADSDGILYGRAAGLWGDGSDPLDRNKVKLLN